MRVGGNGTWLAYMLATIADAAGGDVRGPIRALLGLARLSVHLCFDDFAAVAGRHRAWSLLLAYVATGSSVIGGFYHYASLTICALGAHSFSAVMLTIARDRNVMWIAWRDVKISARLMLWIEAVRCS